MTARSALPHPRDAVVVGGGILGTSTAYHLARAGVTGVTVLEAGELGCGSSAKPLGGVRALFSEPANIALGARSFQAFRRFGTEVGPDIGLHEVGYLFAIRDGDDVRGFEDSIALQRSMGVRSRLVDAAEAVRLCPYLSGADVVAGLWSPDAGFARPADAVHGYAAAAASLGAEIRTSTAVLGIDPTGDRTALVHTANGSYLTPTVICAAGAWSRQVGEMVDVDLPVEPLRRQVALTAPLRGRPPHVPFTIDYSTTAYFHGSEDGGLLLGWADPDEAPGFAREVSTDWHGPLRQALTLFAPAIADVPIVDGWAGLYEMTPDCNALIGATDVGFRFLYATGFSGHGFLQAPAVGECITDLYLGRPTAVDVSTFGVERFNRPAVRTELGII